MHPVTETKCGPWLHWHRGQSSRFPQAHMPTHTTGHTRVRVRSQAVQRSRYTTVSHSLSTSQKGPHGRCKTQVLDTTQLTQLPDPHPSHQVSYVEHKQAHEPCRTPPVETLVSSRSGITSFRVAHYASPQRRCDRSQSTVTPDAAEGLSRSPKAGGQLLQKLPRLPKVSRSTTGGPGLRRFPLTGLGTQCSVISSPARLGVHTTTQSITRLPRATLTHRYPAERPSLEAIHDRKLSGLVLSAAGCTHPMARPLRNSK